MADTILKLAPAPEPPAQAPVRKRSSLVDRLRGNLRMILLVGLPALAIIVGGAFYLSGGRYISTDNAYIGAQKVMITPDISGKVSEVTVREGEHVAAGDPLFKIDPVPFRLALQQAQSKLASVRTDFANLKSNYQSLHQLVELGEQAVDLKRRDLERKTTLLASRSGSQADVDNTKAALVTAFSSSSASSSWLPRSTSCWAKPTCRSSNSRPICRPRPRSSRRNGISIIRPSRPRSPAPPPKWTISNSAGS
jgi:membrane fusion protein (multidrug efflux system)